MHGAEEVGAAIVASTLTTVVVFLPLVFVRGMAGVMFKQLASVVSFALLCSLVVALTLVPMLAARFLRVRSDRRRRRAQRLGAALPVTGASTGLDEAYKRAAAAALRHRAAGGRGLVALFALSAHLPDPLIGTELMPAADEGEVRVNVEMEVGTRLALLDETLPADRGDRRARGARGAADAHRGRRRRLRRRGAGPTRARCGSTSSPWRSAHAIERRDRRRAAREAGRHPRGDRPDARRRRGCSSCGMGAATPDERQVEVRGYDLETADALARRVKDVVEAVAGRRPTPVSRDEGEPERLVAWTGPRPADMRVRVSQVARRSRPRWAGRGPATTARAGTSTPILVKLKDAERAPRPGGILDLTLTNAGRRAGACCATS